MRFPSAVALSRTCGAVLMLVGALVMAGWLLGIRSIVQLDPSFAPMQFNTAACFFLCGVALSGMSWGRRGHILAFSTAAAVTVITSVTALQYPARAGFRYRSVRR
ncbi:MAG TPA: hypothetical protein VNT81_16975 [Vicinamibacterales bacterium]|nr:hypothetical protein [Vicinamibacterales bacterium]